MKSVDASLEAYRQEIQETLKASTLIPVRFQPDNAMCNCSHAAVFAGDRPVILCGTAGDTKGITMALGLASSKLVSELVPELGFEGPIRFGTAGKDAVQWSDSARLIIEKLPGAAVIGGGRHTIQAVVPDDPQGGALSMMLCLAAETVRIIDPEAPVQGLDDGERLVQRARKRAAGCHRVSVADKAKGVLQWAMNWKRG